MSDYIYSKKPVEDGRLTRELQKIYEKDSPEIIEYHGDWGSAAVSRNLYHGFQPYETAEHICIVLGGPHLCFGDTNLPTDSNPKFGTKLILENWLAGKIKWDEDLSGPYTLLIINKRTSSVACVTDLMSFIPVFSYQTEENIFLSTHVDVLAGLTGRIKEADIVSQVDFIMHGVVTFPYTTYKGIVQIKPATEYIIPPETCELQFNSYWEPKEKYKYASIDQVAVDLRHTLQRNVQFTADQSPKIAQFISGGEDSRALAGLLPKNRKQDAYVFLDNMNREGKKAKKAAKAYNANFYLRTRSKSHYVEILPACADLIGEGAQYYHAHTFGFHKSCNLDQYSAVFGGLFSDALLKGARIKKIRGSTRFPFLPQIKRKGYSPGNPLRNNAFKSEVLMEVTTRRQAHLDYVKTFRGESAEEWFELWPSSMNMSIPNLHANRRLFRSYEPFMSKEVVKLSAEVPQEWKMNRRLFQKAAQPLLKPTKWLFHSEGKLPYFSWQINSVIRFFFWVYEEIGKKVGFIKGNQGPWAEWNVVMESDQWYKAMNDYSKGIEFLSDVLEEKEVKKLFNGSYFTSIQRINLMQTLYNNYKKID